MALEIAGGIDMDELALPPVPPDDVFLPIDWLLIPELPPPAYPLFWSVSSVTILRMFFPISLVSE